MKYSVEITSIGPLAGDLLEAGDMVIFEQCEMEALAEVCFMHTKGELSEPVAVGDKFVIGEKTYTVTAVGEEAQHTLKTLGHCTLKFTDKAEVELPGQINLSGDGAPVPKIGDIITIG
ncbi:PTS glucitol/sorbitol transporter subunit IIA [Pectinatus cerevisiiphilus]|uniref:PTS system glucitol/sorbitol-specific IIA component n=1 Tax=Pectinatus cerevisiiphilus TaxID=86956 RepID=A0A4V6NYW9_9FIRM|nr:PTS glucitol/sorbitol transporter subunit IIA [Pectinatus cerevisiiphilus]TCS79952.1 PTS system glucitol/sorbitol-specific IIA component [Pectinatus cerevisiiphilus]